MLVNPKKELRYQIEQYVPPRYHVVDSHAPEDDQPAVVVSFPTLYEAERWVILHEIAPWAKPEKYEYDHGWPTTCSGCGSSLTKLEGQEIFRDTEAKNREYFCCLECVAGLIQCSTCKFWYNPDEITQTIDNGLACPNCEERRNSQW
jgi:hypothetical protein